MQEKVSFIGFSVCMEMSAPRNNCFGGNSAEPRCPPNTVMPRDGNLDWHLKPMKDTYSLSALHGIINYCNESIFELSRTVLDCELMPSCGCELEPCQRHYG